MSWFELFCKMYKLARAHIEDANQPAHPRSLIRDFDGALRIAKDPTFLNLGGKLWLIRLCGCTDHARVQKVLSEGPNPDIVFLDNKGERGQIPLKVGHLRPARETPLKWRFAGVPMMAKLGNCEFYWIRTCIAQKPYIFVIFQGGGVDSLPPPPLWIRDLIEFLLYAHAILYLMLETCSYFSFLGVGSVVECLTRDRKAAGSSLTGVTALCPWA